MKCVSHFLFYYFQYCVSKVRLAFEHKPVLMFANSSLLPDEMYTHIQYIKAELKAQPQLKDCFCYFVPTEEESRVECINPQLVDEKAYQKAKDALDKCTKIMDETAEKLLKDQQKSPV